MDKFEILCFLRAISNYAYDIHYSARGKFFYSDHLFSERLADVDVEDDFIETLYLGESQDAPSSAEINKRVTEITPEITKDADANFKKLRDLIVAVLLGIEGYDIKTKAEDDILGSIAHILQRHNGLLFRQLRYDPKENSNDEDIKEWITVRGNHIPIMKGQTKSEAVKGFIEKNKSKEPEKAKGFWVFDRNGVAEKFAKSEAEANKYVDKKLEAIYGERAKNKELREKEYKIEKHDDNNKKHKLLLEDREKTKRERGNVWEDDGIGEDDIRNPYFAVAKEYKEMREAEERKATAEKKFLEYDISKDIFSQDEDDWSRISSAEKKYREQYGDRAYDELVGRLLQEKAENDPKKEEKAKKEKELYNSLSERSRAIYDRAHREEASITKDVTEEAKKQGTYNTGLYFRKKSLKRLVEKANDDVKAGDKPDFDTAVDSMYDIVRYTQIGTVDNLVETTTKTLKNLMAKGYKVNKIKNFYTNEDNPYSGVNVQMVSPNGVKMEIQFNTSKNASIKEKMHKFYDKTRVSGISKEDEKKYTEKMWKLAPLYERPKGIEKLSEKLLTNS